MDVRTSSLIATIILGALGLTTTVAMALDNTFPRSPPPGSARKFGDPVDAESAEVDQQ
jgi:hypothetical protein